MAAVWVLLDDDGRAEGVYSSEALALADALDDARVERFELDEPAAVREARLKARWDGERQARRAEAERAKAERDAEEARQLARAKAERDAEEARQLARAVEGLAGECERAGLPEPKFLCQASCRDVDLATALVLDLASLGRSDAVHAAVERRIRYGLRSLESKVENIGAFRALAGPFGEELHSACVTFSLT